MHVLAIGAHILDLVLLCGGTLARYALSGHAVSMVVMCSSDTHYEHYPEELIERLAREYRASAAVIGASTYAFGIPSFQLRDDYPTRMRLAEIIRQVRPSVVLTHPPEDYCGDHQTTSGLVRESLFMAVVPGVKMAMPKLQEQPDLVFADTVSGLGFVPDFFVDITAVVEVKRRMVHAFGTEVEDFKDDPVVETLEWMEVTNRYRGIQCGHRYAEAFRWPHSWGWSPSQGNLPGL